MASSTPAGPMVGRSCWHGCTAGLCSLVRLVVRTSGRTPCISRRGLGWKRVPMTQVGFKSCGYLVAPHLGPCLSCFGRCALCRTAVPVDPIRLKRSSHVRGKGLHRGFVRSARMAPHSVLWTFPLHAADLDKSPVCKTLVAAPSSNGFVALDRRSSRLVRLRLTKRRA